MIVSIEASGGPYDGAIFAFRISADDARIVSRGGELPDGDFDDGYALLVDTSGRFPVYRFHWMTTAEKEDRCPDAEDIEAEG